MRAYMRLLGVWMVTVAAGAWAGQPFLWRVEAGGQKPSYLFGSIHIPTPATTNLAPSVEKAFRAADAVYGEVPLDEATARIIAQASMSARQPLSQRLPADLYARTESEMRRVVPGFSLAALERAEIWTVGVALAVLENQLRYPAVPPLDLLLYQRARADGKETGALETAQEQLDALNSLTVAEQVEMLRAELDEMAALRRQGQSPVDRLLLVYLSGDADAVNREVNRSFSRYSPPLRQRFEQALLLTRNRRMADRITERIRAAPDKSTLFVVGTMHGLGKGSVVELLVRAGVKVERVTH